MGRRRSTRTADELLAEARASLPPRLTPHEAETAVGEGAVLLDIRDSDQRRVDGLIPDAIVVARNSLEWRCDPASPWRLHAIETHDQRLVLICNEGFQSSLAAAMLQRLGHRHVTDVVGGVQAWIRSGLPMLSTGVVAGDPRDNRPSSPAAHWDEVYSRGASSVSWFQSAASVSLDLIDGLGLDPDAAVLDVGGGASRLAATLAGRGWKDITVVDLSGSALTACRSELGLAGDAIELIQHDILTWEPQRRFDLWHDRAVLHFFVGVDDRRRYVELLRRSLNPGGAVILGVFGDDGPTQCSGLPVMRYSAEQLLALLGEGFSLVDRRREEHRTPAGGTQRFQWASFRAAT